ncbi:membrane protein [Actinoplanes ianthinogenes]|uniref:Membrane protein n=1 Tax=Actinoplanes ianthinogenes TaxID=122358 RepID=A0ABN6CPD3_9ACTN|nr:glycosyltransferase family 39 protein [Actinoplanes ianthinogenes]BCJ47088.1 membrane protein [Actinoplanes ianthinogenes]GGR51601.1 membrane protein [Actinoplanes ianthinogenes]
MSDVVSIRAGEAEGGTSAMTAPDPVGGGPLGGLRLVAPAVGLYLMLRMFSLEVMYVLAGYAHARSPGRQVYPDGSINNQWRGFTSFADALVSWDGQWYIKIAGSGLGGPVGALDPDGVPYELRLAFFPLYPWLARPLTYLPFVTPVAACLIVSFLSAVAAAAGLYLIGRRLHGHRAGLMLAALWAVVPAAMTQNGAYTESLFTALAVWALYAVLTERWLLAGTLAAIGGLSRPTAVALIGTVGLAALVAAVSRRGGWRPYAAMLLAPLGLLAYFAFASARLGGFTKYTEIHHNTFGARWDNGENTWGMVSDILIGVDDDNAAKPIRVLSLVILAGFIVLLLLLVRRAPWQLTVFAAAMLVMATGTSTHISMIGRHLLPAFPVLLVPAVLLARATTRDRIVVLGALALLSGWYAGWLPFISGQAI